MYWFVGWRLFLNFEVVDFVFYVWVNGVKIGYRWVMNYIILDFVFFEVIY